MQLMVSTADERIVTLDVEQDEQVRVVLCGYTSVVMDACYYPLSPQCLAPA